MIGLPLTVVSLVLFHAGSGAVVQQDQGEDDLRTAVRVFMHGGLSPEVLAASGAGATGVQAGLSAAMEERDLCASFIAAASARSVAVTAWRDAIEQSREDPSNETLRQAVLSRWATLASAEQSMEEAAGAVLAVAMDELPASCAARLAACRQAGARRVPPEMRAASLSAEEWGQLELAVIAERRAARLGTLVPSDAAELLGRVRAQAQVVQAGIDVAQSFAQIEALFSTRE